MESDSLFFSIEIDTNDSKINEPDNKTIRSDLHNNSDTVYRRGQKRPKKKKVKNQLFLKQKTKYLCVKKLF